MRYLASASPGVSTFRFPRPSRHRLALLKFAVVGAWALAGLTEAAAQGTRRGSMPDPQGNEPPVLFPDGRQRPAERVPIFFPPIVPPLDWPVANSVVAPGRLPAPLELATHVNEIFYPVLSTRLYTETMFEKVRGLLTQYRTAKLALQKELQGELHRWRDVDPVARQQALEALARIQTPKIAQLENEADRIRKELSSGNFGWSALRQWHLGDRERRGFSPLEIAIVMRGYAYYQNGLLPAQRQLLREIMIDLLGAVKEDAKASANQAYLFFSPEPARVQLPDDLPPELATKVAAYQTKKSQLKKELYDAVYTYDGQSLHLFRSPLKILAAKQAKGLAEVDTLAEEIRRGLAQNSVPLRTTEHSPLPVALASRIAGLLRDQATAQREATAKADAIQASTYDNVRIRIAYRFDEEGMKSVAVPMRTPRSPGASKEEDAILVKVRADLTAVSEDYGRRIAELFNEQDAIRREAGEFLKEIKREKIDAALISAARIAALKESEEAYTDYRTAVFEPGLSLEQRRLLFDAAIERLALPLPRGEIQITNRTERW
ncbi:MAG: hypothetical protein EXS43_12985 [Opitutus sp.]|nr:hypothetical protein [Opitutus sp.]